MTNTRKKELEAFIVSGQRALDECVELCDKIRKCEDRQYTAQKYAIDMSVKVGKCKMEMETTQSCQGIVDKTIDLIVEKK